MTSVPEENCVLWNQCGSISETFGPWKDEKETANAFHAFILGTGLFRVYREIDGRPLWTHWFQKYKEVRADLLLTPMLKLSQAGWSDGSIVIEVKTPGTKIGPPVSQLIDYMNSAWMIEKSGVLTIPTFGFLFQAPKQRGPIASIMAQQHVGTANIIRGELSLFCGENHVLSTDADGGCRIGSTKFGNGTGAR